MEHRITWQAVDKLLRAPCNDPPISWSKKEIIDYIKWGQEVVNNLPYKDMKLMKRFDKICFQLNKKLSSN